MKTRHFFLALASITALAACEPLPPAVDLPTQPQDSCGAAGYQGLIGQPRAVLQGMSFPIGTRQIGPNDPVTADFRPDRLNIEYGQNGRIEKVSCY